MAYRGAATTAVVPSPRTPYDLAPRLREVPVRRRALPLLLATACTGAAPSTDDTDPPLDPLVYEAPGEAAVGTTALALHDAARDRTLDVQVWYPADDGARAEAEAGADVLAFVPEAYRDRIAALLDVAPDPATLRTAHAAWDAPAADAEATWPLVVFSHCLDCTRASTFTIAERLASHGLAVAAVDHRGGTLYDDLDGAAAPLSEAFLEVRAGDVRVVLDRLLDPSATELPADLRGRFDPARVGLMGHSFGGVTIGRVLDDDPRPRAGLALAVPIESPLLPSVTLAPIGVPLMFVVATEDHSITELGNIAIRNDFATANPPVWKLEVHDAGHWSFTTICGLTPGFAAGCDPEDTRRSDGTSFTWLDVDTARGIAAAYATAFFAATLDDDDDARAYLDLARPEGVVDRDARE